MHKRLGLIAAVLLSAFASLPFSDASAAEPSHPAVVSDAGADEGRAGEQETTRTTDHTLLIHGQTLHYKATAGTLILHDDAGHATASMFYIAYVADRPKGARQRPVTFFHNGGPGSASLWLNIGAFGPVRGATATPKPTPPAPYAYVENQESLLDKTDMVFLDAIGTGYSRTIGAGKDAQFWSVDGDVNAFTRGIIRYLEKNDRWNAPKYLFGESYGTTRSAALAYRLHVQDIDLNGVVLLSSLLNFATEQPGLDLEFINIVPTYAATAWFHHRVPDRPDDLAVFLDRARAFAEGPYADALAKGDGLSTAEEDAVAQKLSSLIGLSPEYLKRNHLRVDMERFRKELLRDQGLVTGRFDSRFTAPDTGAVGTFDPATDDPATAGVNSLYLTGFRRVLTEELGYASSLHYRPLFNAVIEPQWDFHHKAPGIDAPLSTANTALDLAATMEGNPNMKVLSLNGYYDMATPFFGTETDVSHMLLPPEIRRNLSFKYYSSGHMGYTDGVALRAMKVDLDRFYDQTN